jgi:hypothetical protein
MHIFVYPIQERPVHHFFHALWVGIATRLRACRLGEQSWFSFRQSKHCFLLSPLHLIWYIKLIPAELFPGVKQQAYEVTNHLALMTRLKVHGSTPPVPHTPSWGAQRHLYLYFHIRVFYLHHPSYHILFHRSIHI